MVKIKGPVPPTPAKVSDIAEDPLHFLPNVPDIPAQTTTEQATMQAAMERLRELRKTKRFNLMEGAVRLFGGEASFPAELLDPHDPQNDANYLRLLATLLGLEDLYDFPRRTRDNDDTDL